MLRRILFSAVLFVISGSIAFGQTATGNEFQTSTSGKLVSGIVNMCVNASNVAVPCGSASSPVLTTQAGSGNIATGQVTIGTTATQVVPARAGRISVKTTNLGTTDIFCGPAGVTIATGDLLAGVKGGVITVPTGAAFYCVVATGTQAVSFMESY